LSYYVIENDKLKVAALVDASQGYSVVIPAIGFLQQKAKEGQYSASALAFKSIFKRYAGGEQLPSVLFHEANKEKKVWEFIKGDLRVFCFKDSRGSLMLTGACIKKGQKADTSEVERAARARTDFGDKVI
jgi:hypothetical protein